ncbi:MAG TPA: cyclopropane-fatty-acyl-phospholipid synthase family protein [Alphaproteobacteria bacterium]|nr:cyclopropane-fatty-acyl-phospholipid synthase family protein [Alphaproteobacteria bacterium]
MPSDQSQAIEYGKPLEPGTFDFTAGDATASLKRAPNAFLTKVLSRLQKGRVIVQTPAGDCVGYTATEPGPEATIILNNWRPVRWLLWKGDLGFAESYMEGDWTTPDLAAFLELAALNVESLDADITGSFLVRAIRRFKHARSANSKRGSRRNIASHYDLGNDFYERWLDTGMSYSSALYTEPGQSLEAAQTAKQDLVLDRLALKGGEKVLEIGCGWGGLAERVLDRGAGDITCLTLSTEQHAYSRDRLEKAGLAARGDIRLQDYRDVTGKFDRIVSIEMLEAVGQEFWPAYFDALNARLTDDGIAVLQVITISEARYNSYEQGVDFIQRYIFPGGMLPSKEIMREQIARAGFEIRSLENFGKGYAQTLAEWNRRFQDAWPAIHTFGFDRRFKHMWEYYLAYCESGFRSGILDVGLYCIGRPS